MFYHAKHQSLRVLETKSPEIQRSDPAVPRHLVDTKVLDRMRKALEEVVNDYSVLHKVAQSVELAA
jgi:hypothetical protein